MSNKKAFEDWVESKFVNHDSEIVMIESRDIWDGACAYKDKRIAELEERIKRIKWLIGPISGRVSDMIYQECVISEGGADD